MLEFWCVRTGASRGKAFIVDVEDFRLFEKRCLVRGYWKNTKKKEKEKRITCFQPLEADELV